MIHELEPAQFSAITPLLDHGFSFPEVRSVIASTNPGWIFADPLLPHTALIWAKGIEGFYLVGDPANKSFLNELNNYITTTITPRAKACDLSEFEVSGNSPSWHGAIESVFSDRELNCGRQLVFVRPPREIETPSGSLTGPYAQLRPIDNAMLVDWTLLNTEFLDDKLSDFWEGNDGFIKNGFGFAVIQDRVVASLCLSAFVTTEEMVIDIETHEPFRKKGYGHQVAAAFCAECEKRGLTAHWDCMETNTASAALATKLEFEQIHRYRLYSFRF
jgi:RimJ/RimL family protein N-acetyltransferase